MPTACEIFMNSFRSAAKSVSHVFREGSSEYKRGDATDSIAEEILEEIATMACSEWSLGLLWVGKDVVWRYCENEEAPGMIWAIADWVDGLHDVL